MTEAFHMAWNLVKNREPVYPIGIHINRKIVMYYGKPYYQSKGESKSSFGHKVKGSWQPFGGVEPDVSQWIPHAEGEWYMKGQHPDIPRHAQNVSKEESVLGQYIGLHDHKIEDWSPLANARQVNQALAQYGWEAPIKGEYPTEILEGYSGE